MRKFTQILMVGLALVIGQIAIQAQVNGSIAGTVSDPNGAALPGASVRIVGTAGQDFTATTNENGQYRVPGVESGLYTVTVTAPGFKTTNVKNVKVDIGTPSTVDAKLEIGAQDVIVEVSGGGEVLQTQTATVGTTITGRQINQTPISSRDALDLILRLPGVVAVGAPRQSSINGLPKGAISMTLDGVDDQDNVLRSSDGFFTFVRPRVDAIEEVVVSTATPGAESSGDGAVTVKFVTKRGTDRYTGSVYEQVRNTSLNSAYFYTNRDHPNGFLADGVTARRDKIQLNQPGFSFGGPIPFPRFGEGKGGWDSGKGKRFFFINYEQYRLPGTVSRQRTVLNPDIQSGKFHYLNGGVDTFVQMFGTPTSVAATNGQVNTIDPTVDQALNAITAATAGGSFTSISSTELNRRFFNFSNAANGYREFLAGRFDFNIGKNHAIEYVQNRQNFHPSIDTINGADAPFPGGSSYGQGGIRKTWSFAERATLSKSLVNEARYAVGGGGTDFNSGCCKADYASQNGWNLGVWGALGITAPAAVNNIQGRTTPTNDFTDNLTWIRGNHTIAMGGQIKRIKTVGYFQSPFVPSVGFGFSSATADQTSTAFTMFNTTTMPGASPTDLSNARAFYAGLTGRVSSYTNTGNLVDNGTYVAGGNQITSVQQFIYGLYGQDTWKIRPNLTINFGLRWQPDMGVENLTKNQSRLQRPEMLYGEGGFANMFQPQNPTNTANRPANVLLEVGEQIIPRDLNNFAPSVGFVWSPKFEKGIGHFLMGDPGKTVFRGGWSTSFVREGLNVGLQVVAGPGGSVSLSRSTSINGPLGPVLNPSYTPNTYFRDAGNPNLTPFVGVGSNLPAFPTPSFPLSLVQGTDQGFGVDPNITTGMVDSFNFGVQRELDKDTVIEVRYVGNRGKKAWRLYNVNERNVIENGFAKEFLVAQTNLYANEAAYLAGDNSRRYCGGFFAPTEVTPSTQRCFSSANNANNVVTPQGVHCVTDPNPPASCFTARLPTMAYYGGGTGTSALPILYSYLNAAGGTTSTLAQGALGTGGTVTCTGTCQIATNYYTNNTTLAGLFANSTFVARLNKLNPVPQSLANDMEGNATRRAQALATGLPTTFFFVNPTLNAGAFLLGNTQNSWYNSIVVEMRRRLSHGLRVQASYVLSKAEADYTAVSSIVNSSFSLRPGGLDAQKTVQPFDVRHVFKLDTTYDLPFGRGRTFFSNAGKLVDAIVGGWSVLPVVSLQSGTPIFIGNAQLVGLTPKEFEKLVKVHPGSGSTVGGTTFSTAKMYWLPENFIAQSQRAFDLAIGSVNNNGYGTTFGGVAPTGQYIAPAGTGNCLQNYAGAGCGFTNLAIHGPKFFKVDIGLSKKIPIGETHSFEMRANALNFLNNPNFRVGGWASNNPGSGCCGGTFGELGSGSAYIDNNTTNDPGGRVIDLQFRINW